MPGSDSKKVLTAVTDARHQQALHLYDIEELTMEKIGPRLGLDQSRVSLIRADALDRLRVQLRRWFSELR